MFDKLIDFLIEFLDDAKFWFFVREWEKCVLLRAGRFHKEYPAGLYFKIPFLDEPNLELITLTTNSLPPQSLTTKDHKQIIIRAAISYYTEDPTKKMLEIYDSSDVVSDLTQGVIKKIVVDTDYTNLILPEVERTLTVKVRDTLRKYGIYTDRVTITDLTLSKSFRIFNDTIESVV